MGLDDAAARECRVEDGSASASYLCGERALLVTGGITEHAPLRYLVLSTNAVSAGVPLQRELTRVAELDDVARR